MFLVTIQAQGKAFWITDSGRSYWHGYDSKFNVRPQAGTNWTGEDGNYYIFWYTSAR